MSARDVDNQGCAVCGEIPYDGERRVVVVGRQRISYCSQACLRIGVRKLQIARRNARLRQLVAVLSLALVAVGVGYVRHLWLHHRRRVVTAAPPPSAAPPAEPEEIAFGPHWPPTDEEWLEEFAHASWVYPLPGPARRRARASAELVTGEPKGQARCRSDGRCGVDVGGELWGEHVYAAHDGIVERVGRDPGAPGGIYVRIASWGGAVLTQYFHLAAVPIRLAAGTRVNAGDVIGLVGDTGATHARAHLRFALSVRPAKALPEVYWDPEPLMMGWPLRTPGRGSVAGVTSVDAPAEIVAGMISPQQRQAALRRAR
jgi:peptidase M23-like protein